MRLNGIFLRKGYIVVVLLFAVFGLHVLEGFYHVISYFELGQPGMPSLVHFIFKLFITKWISM